MALPADSVEIQLEKILTSPVFLSTELLSRFLRFIVDQTLAGRSAWLKESVLGAEIFGRGDSFDPRLDPVVRVDARRLRTKLAEYYLMEGRLDPIVISLPKGGYVPTFFENPAVDTSVKMEPPEGASVAVLPFVNLGEDTSFDYFCDGMAEEVIEALAAIPGLQVVGRSASFRYRGKAQDIRKVGAELHVSMVLEGSVRKVGARVRVGAQLIDASTCFHRGSQSWEREITDILGVQREVADAIALFPALRPVKE